MPPIRLTSAFRRMRDLVAPSRCPGCGARVEDDGAIAICASCTRGLRRAPPAVPPPPVAWWVAVFAYEGAARELVARAKYRGERHGLRAAGATLASAVAASGRPVDLVTWAPASRARRRDQGVDHAEVLARSVAAHLGRPVRPLLRRGRAAPQTGRSAPARRRGPDLVGIVPLSGVRVLVVDDVATTGATLASAARALRRAGAAEIGAATFARTPRPGSRESDGPYTSTTISA